MNHHPPKDKQSTTTICGMCAARCSILVETQASKPVWVQGNPHDPVMASSLCAKGAAGLSFEYDNERPDTPLIRAGERGEGKWRKASWDEALNYISEKLYQVIEEMGPQGIVLSDRGGPFTDLTKSFLKAIGSPNYFDHDCSCGLNAHHATQSLLGFGRLGVAYDYTHSKHIVLYGRNLLESLVVPEVKAFTQALRNGAKCTYIDVRKNITASKASRFWQINPGTDYALNLAIIHELIHKNLYNRPFVERWTDGFNELKQFVTDKTPEWASQYTGIPAHELVDFVAEIAADAPAVIFHAGWHSARYTQSFYTSRSTHIINALLGNFEALGGCILTKNADNYGHQGLTKLQDAISDINIPRVDGVGTQYPRWDPDIGVLHRIFPALETQTPYALGAYIAYRHDPLVSMPDPDKQRRLLDKLNLIVSIDVNYSETGWFADVILPESSYLERDNILSEEAGIIPRVRIRQKVMQPRFDSKPAWWIFTELARKLNKTEGFDYKNIEDIWRYQLQKSPVKLKQLKQQGVHYYAAKPTFWSQDSELIFPTPSGKIEFVNSLWEQSGIASLVEFEPPQSLQNGEFRLVFGRVAMHTHAQTMNNPLLHEIYPENPLWMHPDSAQKLGIKNAEQISIERMGVTLKGPVMLTDKIHPEVVFMVHGFGRNIPLQTRAFHQGISDQELEGGVLNSFDLAGGGFNFFESIVTIHRTGEQP